MKYIYIININKLYQVGTGAQHYIIARKKEERIEEGHFFINFYVPPKPGKVLSPCYFNANIIHIIICHLAIIKNIYIQKKDKELN